MDWIFFDRGGLVTDLAFLLLAVSLGWAQHKLYSTPNRSWEEVGWIARLGRLVLIALTLALFIVPLWWWLTKS